MEHIHPSQSRTHIPIFSYEQKGGAFTGDIICSVCGVYLAAHHPLSLQEQALATPEARP